MKIRKVELTNFKRFSDLTIDLGRGNLPKLVLLIGANGSGKSGVFDAFERVSNKAVDIVPEPDYYRKGQTVAKILIDFDNQKSVHYEIYGNPATKMYLMGNESIKDSSFYGRSATRYLPRITHTSIGQNSFIVENSDRPNFYIDFDNRFENDINTLIYDILQKVFKGINTNSPEQLDDIKAFLSRINESFTKIFDDKTAINLRFLELQIPHDGIPVRILFQKGDSIINYDLLSSGEKEVINILFNLFVRTPHYQDTIYFFDELDTHLHTSLQYNLLKEITENWIPENCQIWSATHSLGFIQYAKSSKDAVIIDFDSLDFDIPQYLTPDVSSEVFEIAVPKETLDVLFRDKKKIFCERNNASLFNLLGLQDCIFLGETDKNSIYLRIKDTPEKTFGLMDRDYLSDIERESLIKKYPNLIVLDYYCLENYMYHPDNIKELVPDFDVEKYRKMVTDRKNEKKDEIIYGLRNSRQSYIFFTQADIKNNKEDVFQLLNSDVFEDFYKVFNMKNRGGLTGLQNPSEKKLVKTQWFKSKMEALILS